MLYEYTGCMLYTPGRGFYLTHHVGIYIHIYLSLYLPGILHMYVCGVGCGMLFLLLATKLHSSRPFPCRLRRRDEHRGPARHKASPVVCPSRQTHIETRGRNAQARVANPRGHLRQTQTSSTTTTTTTTLLQQQQLLFGFTYIYSGG